jgi:hypothetical protein
MTVLLHICRSAVGTLRNIRVSIEGRLALVLRLTTLGVRHQVSDASEEMLDQPILEERIRLAMALRLAATGESLY